MMSIHPRAGQVAQPSDLVDVPALVTAYLLERWLRWHADAALGATTATAERHDAILTTAAARSGIAREPV